MLYDYEAEEENEMALVEGEIIEQIEQIDEGLANVYFCDLKLSACQAGGLEWVLMERRVVYFLVGHSWHIVIWSTLT